MTLDRQQSDDGKIEDGIKEEKKENANSLSLFFIATDSPKKKEREDKGRGKILLHSPGTHLANTDNLFESRMKNIVCVGALVLCNVP